MKEGSNINVPYIDECPISIECKVKSIIPLGTHDLFIAEVVGSHVNKNLMDEKGKIHFENADLITYCHGEYFKMDTEALGKFGYSVAKKPLAIKNSQSKDAETSVKVKNSSPSKEKNNKKSNYKKSSKKKNSSKTNLKSKSKKTYISKKKNNSTK